MKRYNPLRTDHPRVEGPKNWDGMNVITVFNNKAIGTCYNANLAYSSIKEAKRYFNTFCKTRSFRKRIYG